MSTNNPIDDPVNPYQEDGAAASATLPRQEHREARRVVVRNPDGTTSTISQVQEAIILNPRTGERTLLTQQELSLTADNRLILDPEHTPLYACVGPCKNTTLSLTKCCALCEQPCCPTCVKHVTIDAQPTLLCPDCAHATRWKRRRQWLTSID